MGGLPEPRPASRRALSLSRQSCVFVKSELRLHLRQVSYLFLSLFGRRKSNSVPTRERKSPRRPSRRVSADGGDARLPVRVLRWPGWRAACTPMCSHTHVTAAPAGQSSCGCRGARLRPQGPGGETPEMPPARGSLGRGFTPFSSPREAARPSSGLACAEEELAWAWHKDLQTQPLPPPTGPGPGGLPSARAAPCGSELPPSLTWTGSPGKVPSETPLSVTS